MIRDQNPQNKDFRGPSLMALISHSPGAEIAGGRISHAPGAEIAGVRISQGPGGGNRRGPAESQKQQQATN